MSRDDAAVVRRGLARGERVGISIPLPATWPLFGFAAAPSRPPDMFMGEAGKGREVASVGHGRLGALPGQSGE